MAVCSVAVTVWAVATGLELDESIKLYSLTDPESSPLVVSSLITGTTTNVPSLDIVGLKPSWSPELSPDIVLPIWDHWLFT